MSVDIKLDAKKREEKGSRAMGRLRKAGQVPAIVYGEGKTPKMVQIHEHTFTQLLRHHSSEHIMMDLAIEGDGICTVLLQDVQHHPVTGQIVHADFHEVDMLKKLHVSVPVELIGTPEGVSQGGVLEHLHREVELECLPGDIPEVVRVDVSKLKMGETVTFGEIELDNSRFSLVSPADLALVGVLTPRVAVEGAAEGEDAAAEPEVITAKKSEE